MVMTVHYNVRIQNIDSAHMHIPVNAEPRLQSLVILEALA